MKISQTSQTTSRRRRRSRHRQRGNAILVALIALTGLGTLGILTVSTVQGGLTSVTVDRGHAIALQAAESGVMVGMRYLSLPTYDYEPFPDRGFSYVVVQGNSNPLIDNTYDLPGLPGNRAQPGASGNVFSPSMKAWYDVSVLNNRTDPGYLNGSDFEDTDGRIVFRATGYGPGRASARVEVEVKYLEPEERFVILSWREIQ